MYYRKNIRFVTKYDQINENKISPPTVNFHKKFPSTKQNIKVKITHRNIPEKKKNKEMNQDTHRDIKQDTKKEIVDIQKCTHQDMLDIQRDIDDKLFSIIND
jgi:peroxiredoxin family protein